MSRGTTVPLSPTKNTCPRWVAREKQCKQSTSHNTNRCVHPEIPTDTLSLYGTPSPRPYSALRHTF